MTAALRLAETMGPSASGIGMWNHPAVIARNHFLYKSLSDWSFNTAVGCSHGCRFCYVPSVSTVKQSGRLSEFGVRDPDAEWGQYVLLRPWDETAFLKSLKAAEGTHRKELSRDGNRAIMFSTTTDPYQRSFPTPIPQKRAVSPRSAYRRCAGRWNSSATAQP